MIWLGRMLTDLFVTFMLGASIAPKLFRMPIAEETMTQLGWPADYAFPLGLIELACLILYLVPRTKVFGALMGLLGGAMATKMRVEAPLLSDVRFSIYLGLFMWAGLWLRDSKVRALFPWRAALSECPLSTQNCR